jgi:hypothetical protein
MTGREQPPGRHLTTRKDKRQAPAAHVDVDRVARFDGVEFDIGEHDLGGVLETPPGHGR